MPRRVYLVVSVVAYDPGPNSILELLYVARWLAQRSGCILQRILQVRCLLAIYTQSFAARDPGRLRLLVLLR